MNRPNSNDDATPVQPAVPNGHIDDDYLLIKGYVIPHALLLPQPDEIIDPPRWLDAMMQRR